MARMAFVPRAALPASDAAPGRNGARLAGCVGSASPLRDRLGMGRDARAQGAARNLVLELAR